MVMAAMLSMISLMAMHATVNFGDPVPGTSRRSPCVTPRKTRGTTLPPHPPRKSSSHLPRAAPLPRMPSQCGDRRKNPVPRHADADYQEPSFRLDALRLPRPSYADWPPPRQCGPTPSRATLWRRELQGRPPCTVQLPPAPESRQSKRPYRRRRLQLPSTTLHAPQSFLSIRRDALPDARPKSSTPSASEYRAAAPASDSSESRAK